MTREGLDYAWHGALNPAQWGHDGISFVVRYFSHDPAKDLQLAEARQVSAAGLDLVIVWENLATDNQGGAALGARYAKEAAGRQVGVGAPANARVYFAIDNAADPVQVEDYFTGIVSVLPPGQVGVYGDNAVCKTIHAKWPAILMWQTIAWSGHQWAAGVAMEQYGVTYSGGGLTRADRNRALLVDFGQWRIGSVPNPPPHPSPIVPDHTHPILSHGAIGPQVRNMQLLLIHKGFSCGPHGADGDWGTDTQAAVIAFQTHIRATLDPTFRVDGICGPFTWGALEA